MITADLSMPSTQHTPAVATVAYEVTSEVHSWPGMSQRARLIARILGAILLTAGFTASGAVWVAAVALPLWAALEFALLQRRRRSARGVSLLLWRPSGAHLAQAARTV